MSTVGDIMSTLGDIMSTLGDVTINVGKVIGKTIEFVWKPQCTEHSPVYSLPHTTLIVVSPHTQQYPLSVLMVSPVY